jgi:hypothetical protein
MRTFVIVALVLALLLPGCASAPAQVTTTQTLPQVTTTAPQLPTLLIDVSAFSKWLDAEKMKGHLDQEDFKKLIAQYSLDGTAVSALASVTEYCANPGSYYAANGNGFSFTKKTELLSDWYYQTNTITVRTLLDGMESPFILSFEDTYLQVLGKFLENFDPETDFVPDADNRYEMTLYEGVADRLFLRHKGSDYSITYKQKKVYLYSETRLINVDRSVVLSFGGPDQRLREIRLEMIESWRANT